MQNQKFPTKTKIAAWWMMILGTVGLIPLMFLEIISFSKFFIGSGAIDIVCLIGILILFNLYFFLLGIFLLKRKRWAWKAAIVGIFIYLAVLLFGFFIAQYKWYAIGWYLGTFMPYLMIVIPLVFLLLDRKNFFEVAK